MPGSSPSSLLRWVLPIVPCLFSLPLGAEPNAVAELDTVRENLSRALAYRDQAAREQQAWELRKGEMENLILLAEEETRNLETIIELARPILENLESRKLELAMASEESRDLVDFLRSAAPALGANLLEKSARWPEPLIREVQPQLHEIEINLARLPGTGSEPGLQKLIRSTIEALEVALAFQNKIHLNSVLHTLEDGRTAHFEVVYLGLATGFYLSDELGLVGEIVMRDGEWRWEARDDLLEPVRTFVEILKEERRATWVGLPIGSTSEEGAP